MTKLSLSGHALSPIKHLYVRAVGEDRELEQSLVRRIVDECHLAGLAVCNAEYLEEKERDPSPRPSIRIAVNRLLSAGDIHFAFATLERVSKEVLASVS